MKLKRILVLAAAMALLITAIPAFDQVAKAGYDMPYYIKADLTNQIVTIYSTETDNIVRQMLCSSGLENATPHGTYYLPKKTEEAEREEWYYFRSYDCYAHYATRIFKGVLFHSIPYKLKDESTISESGVANFGKPASHGCLRLRWQDAEFIAKCCLPGTRVKIYTSKKEDEDTRRMLLRASYTNEKGQSYDYFQANAHEEGVLGNGSKGSEVRDLQTRLRDLGIYSDGIDGRYGGATINAVRDAQQLMGVEETGLATPEFLQVIYSDEAPTATNVTLEEGMSGPVVRNVQQQLADLKLYDGAAIDGVFDVDVLQAVKQFQSAYAYPTDGVLVPGMQKALEYEAGKVQSLFSEDDCALETTSDQLNMAKTNLSVSIRLRSEPSSSAAALTSLTSENVVIALERNKGWSHVQRGTNVGYVKDDFLDYYTQDISSLTYKASDSDKAYTIGYTKQEYLNGVMMPWEVFANYLATDGELEDYEGMTTYAQVNTDGPNVTLNLREAPNTESAILAEVPYQTQVRVLLRSSEWSYVEYDGKNGYLLNQYLAFWGAKEGEAEAGEAVAAEVAADNSVLPAVVRATTDKKAPVYDVDSEDANVLGHLDNGTRVEVIETVDGWSHISLQGHEGYMKDADLQFMLAEEIAT
ncbi:MAG: SH3 domain-containing protein [Clostridia bacterium]|nr:SH3 domain-containing protein [Clostridia bacterium]